MRFEHLDFNCDCGAKLSLSCYDATRNSRMKCPACRKTFSVSIVEFDGLCIFIKPAIGSAHYIPSFDFRREDNE